MSLEASQDLFESIVNGIQETVNENVQTLLAEGVPAREILEIIITAMGEVGRKYEAHEYFLPDMVLAGDSMKSALAIILPTLRQEENVFRGKVLLGSVQGDIHDIGKSIVGNVLLGAGYEVFDLGVDVPCEVFVHKAQELEVDVVGASSYMTTTTPELPKINEALITAGIRKKVKFIIGGACTSQSYVTWAGADGWAETAFEVPKLVNKLLHHAD